MSFEMRMVFPNVSKFSSRYICEERERLEKVGWFVGSSYCASGFRVSPIRNEPVIEREIQQFYLAEVHWNQRFLGLEPEKISVFFRNSLLPKNPSWSIPTQIGESSGPFLDTRDYWERFESDVFPGFWYEIVTSRERKTLEIRVSGGQQLGKENLKKFLLTLKSYHTATKVARCLHQLRTAANKQSFQEMDRYHNEILETLGRNLPH